MNAIIRHDNEMEAFLNPKHRDVYMKHIATSKDNDRVSTHVVTIKPGGEIVPHTHDVVEVFYVLRGEGSALVNGERQKAAKGTVIIAPAGSEHGMINAGEEDLEMYCVFSPGTV